MQKLDQCLLQLAEFTLAQEQLTKWLRDVEKAMQAHTELKATLQEKKAQLQVIRNCIFFVASMRVSRKPFHLRFKLYKNVKLSLHILHTFISESQNRPPRDSWQSVACDICLRKSSKSARPNTRWISVNIPQLYQELIRQHCGEI